MGPIAAIPVTRGKRTASTGTPRTPSSRMLQADVVSRRIRTVAVTRNAGALAPNRSHTSFERIAGAPPREAAGLCRRDSLSPRGAGNLTHADTLRRGLPRREFERPEPDRIRRDAGEPATHSHRRAIRDAHRTARARPAARARPVADPGRLLPRRWSVTRALRGHDRRRETAAKRRGAPRDGRDASCPSYRYSRNGVRVASNAFACAFHFFTSASTVPCSTAARSSSVPARRSIDRSRHCHSFT